MRSSWTMTFNLTAKHLEVIVVNWESRIGILPLPIPKGTDKQRMLIKL